MPIEGPLEELGIQDVFQLLDLSRKTGMLRVTSGTSDDEGTVFFDGGRVVQASLRSAAVSLDEMLLQSGRVRAEDLHRAHQHRAQMGSGANVADVLIQAGVLTARELDRLMRQQIESVVFELMAWREGFFSFEERPASDLPAGRRVDIPTESLLMESARRIDEWSRIASKVPNLSVIPSLAAVSPEHETQLDLLPHEWEVLTMIDGDRDLKVIAAALNRDEFEVAKIAFGLVTTGVIELRPALRLSIATPVEETPGPAARAELVERGFAAAKAGDLKTACAAWQRFLSLAPSDPAVPRVRAALEAATTLGSALEAQQHG